MVIEIPDAISGYERSRMLDVLPIMYAYSIFKTVRAVADFLGVSEKTIRNINKRHPELLRYRRKTYTKTEIEEVINSMNKREQDIYNHGLMELKNSLAWSNTDEHEKLEMVTNLIRDIVWS
jgi:predicted transcriptional regulator